MDEIDGYITPTSSSGCNKDHFNCELSEKRDIETSEIDSDHINDLKNDDNSSELDKEDESIDEVCLSQINSSLCNR